MKREEILPKQYSIVRLMANVRKDYQEYLDKNKGCKKARCASCKIIDRGSCIAFILKEEVFIFLGEIPNMPGHVVVAGMNSGKIFAGYHPENFETLSDEET